MSEHMDLLVTELRLVRGAETSEYTQLVARTADGRRWVIEGAYCGGIPFSYWAELEDDPTFCQCGHEWCRHDPEDGNCEAGAFPPCSCGPSKERAAKSRRSLETPGE